MNFVKNLGISPTVWIAIAVIIVIVIIIIVVIVKRNSAQKAESAFPLTYKSPDTSKGPIVIAKRDMEAEITDPIEQVADTLNTNTAEVKLMLGIPILEKCTAEDTDEAEDAFNNADSSEEQYVALMRWVELENDVENMENLYDTAEEFPSVQTLIQEKWIVLSLREIDAAETEEELIYADEKAPWENTAEIAKKLYALYQKA
ncbi:MAG: hypothetical protein ABIO57_02070 [Candidatus Paceibacterota bacterium]